jgi:hypothetical protein
MAEIRIGIEGVPARMINGRWSSEDKTLARLLRERAEVALEPGRYYPDPDLAIAEDAAEAFLGKITHVDPLHRPADQGLVY